MCTIFSLLILQELKLLRKEMKKTRREIEKMSKEVDDLKTAQTKAFAEINSGLDNIAADLKTQSDQIGQLMQQLASGNLSSEDKTALAALSQQAQSLADRVTLLKEVVPGN